jgi:uncharacterized protein YjbI with pentapeptide repeats
MASVCTFAGANLEEALFGATDLRGVDLRGARLNRAFLYEARLRGVIADPGAFEDAVVRAEAL